MTKRNNLTKGERWQVLEKKLQQMEMAMRVNQMLIQQIGNSVTAMSKDIGELSSRLRNLQYGFLAMQEATGIARETIDARAEELQITDFTEVSDKEDIETGAIVVDEVADDCAVILTSTLTDGKGGILRSRLKVSEIGFPQLRQDIIGKKVGDTVEADLAGEKHTIVILGVRKLPVETTETTTAPIATLSTETSTETTAH